MGKGNGKQSPELIFRIEHRHTTGRILAILCDHTNQVKLDEVPVLNVHLRSSSGGMHNNITIDNAFRPIGVTINRHGEVVWVE